MSTSSPDEDPSWENFPVSLFVRLGIALRVKVRFTILNTVESKSKKESSLKSLFTVFAVLGPAVSQYDWKNF